MGVYAGAVRTLVFSINMWQMLTLFSLPKVFGMVLHSYQVIALWLMTFLYSGDIFNLVFPFHHGGYYLVVMLNVWSEFFFKCFSYFVEMTKEKLASYPVV